jgi:hypothetical protein
VVVVDVVEVVVVEVVVVEVVDVEVVDVEVVDVDVVLVEVGLVEVVEGGGRRCLADAGSTMTSATTTDTTATAITFAANGQALGRLVITDSVHPRSSEICLALDRQVSSDGAAPAALIDVGRRSAAPHVTPLFASRTEMLFGTA